jgi:hypothetical protein
MFSSVAVAASVAIAEGDVSNDMLQTICQRHSAVLVEAGQYDEMASALNSTDTKVHQLVSEVQQLRYEQGAQKVQLFHQFTQAQIVQMVAHRTFL